MSMLHIPNLHGFPARFYRNNRKSNSSKLLTYEQQTSHVRHSVFLKSTKLKSVQNTIISSEAELGFFNPWKILKLRPIINQQ